MMSGITQGQSAGLLCTESSFNQHCSRKNTQAPVSIDENPPDSFVLDIMTGPEPIVRKWDVEQLQLSHLQPPSKCVPC